jgi:hypothetical protein
MVAEAQHSRPGFGGAAWPIATASFVACTSFGASTGTSTTVIARLDEAGVDALQLQRLKKRKLKLKDEIAWLESRLVPDIIA